MGDWLAWEGMDDILGAIVALEILAVLWTLL
jgi:hypothetical protein